MGWITNKPGFQPCSGESAEEAAWRFFSQNRQARKVQVQCWHRVEGGSQLVDVQTLSKADVRRAIPGSLSSC